MANLGYPADSVSGYNALIWAMNNFIQTAHEYESMSVDDDQACEMYMEMVDAALYVLDAVQATVTQLR